MSHLRYLDALGHLLRLGVLAAFLAILPVRVDFLASSLIDFSISAAHAKGGDDGDDDNSGSGSGGSDDDDDDDDDDDNSGSGSGGDDDDDDSADDDNSGPDDDGGEDAGDGSYSGGDSDRKLEVRLADGTRIEIDDGIFERRDASGRVVERRRATQRDYSLLKQAGVGNGAAKGTRSKVAQIRLRGEDIEVIYSDGWREVIRSGRYVLTDPLERTVIRRRAKQSDYERLNALAGK
ncbi:MAG: hypothetical protein ACRCSU_00640 [Paracoccaceae bacterium]